MLASLVAVTIAATPAPITEQQAACAGKDGWSDPAPPVHVFGNVYNVGTCGIVALIVAGDKGHILIDGATEKAAPSIARNIERLGFRLGDVRLIVGSHEHDDHAGGLAELQRLTGATVRLSPVSTQVLRSGRLDPRDPQVSIGAPLARLKPGKPLRDRETVRLGGLRLTAHLTPGHSPGGTSWAWRSCEGDACASVVFADSLSAVSADDYRFADHPERVRELRKSFARVGELSCTLLITPHPSASRFYNRLAGDGQLQDAAACKDYAARAAERLQARLAREKAAAP
jgi:metallo-beta-lactamase class B